MLKPIQAIIKDMPLCKNIQKQVKVKPKPKGTGEFKQILDRLK